MLDASLPRRGISDNAREILKHLHAAADRNGIGQVRIQALMRVAMCNHRAAVIALYELPASGDVAMLAFKGDIV